ncbi:MAG: dienelactone hydrolase family protein [Myxococcota bacterium]
MSSSEHALTRRQLLISGAAAAGYALAARPVSARAIKTDATGLVSGVAAIPVEDAEISGFYAYPEGAKSAPVALVVHEIFGVHEYIRDVCRRFAKAGYFAVAPDLYQRQGDVATLPDTGRIVREVVMKVPDAQVLADLDAALAWAGDHEQADASRAVITGFCWGGRIVWLYAAHNPQLVAGAAWYGRLVGEPRAETPKHPVDLAAQLHAPVLGLYGSEDKGIPLATVDEMRRRLSAGGQTSEIVLFPAAPHGFHADYRPSYRSLAADEGWRRMLAWFESHRAR